MVYANRYSTSNVQLTKGGVVVHTSEGGEGALSSAALIGFMEQPGTRDNGSGGTYGSSYHAVATENGGYTQVLGADAAPFAAPPLNQEWWHIVMPGKAAQTRDQWLDAVSYQYIKGVAKFIYDKHLIDNIPLKKVSPTELRAAGEKALFVGYCGHWDVSLAFGQSDHTDPGVNFPWDVLAAELNALLPPPPPPPPVIIPPAVKGTNVAKIVRWDSSPTWHVTDGIVTTPLPDYKAADWLVINGLAEYGVENSTIKVFVNSTDFRYVPVWTRALVPWIKDA